MAIGGIDPRLLLAMQQGRAAGGQAGIPGQRPGIPGQISAGQVPLIQALQQGGIGAGPGIAGGAPAVGPVPGTGQLAGPALQTIGQGGQASNDRLEMILRALRGGGQGAGIR